MYTSISYRNRQKSSNIVMPTHKIYVYLLNNTVMHTILFLTNLNNEEVFNQTVGFSYVHHGIIPTLHKPTSMILCLSLRVPQKLSQSKVTSKGPWPRQWPGFAGSLLLPIVFQYQHIHEHPFCRTSRMGSKWGVKVANQKTNLVYWVSLTFR